MLFTLYILALSLYLGLFTLKKFSNELSVGLWFVSGIPSGFPPNILWKVFPCPAWTSLLTSHSWATRNFYYNYDTWGVLTIYSVYSQFQLSFYSQFWCFRIYIFYNFKNKCESSIYLFYLIILAALSLILNMDSPKLTVTSISGILSSDLTPNCVYVSITWYHFQLSTPILRLSLKNYLLRTFWIVFVA